jgi:hypothetical protein
MYHGAGWIVMPARFAMCCRETSSTSPSSEYVHGIPRLSAVGSFSDNAPVLVRVDSSFLIGRESTNRPSPKSMSPMNSHADSPNFSRIAYGTPSATSRGTDQCTGRGPIAAPKR